MFHLDRLHGKAFRTLPRRFRRSDLFAEFPIFYLFPNQQIIRRMRDQIPHDSAADTRLIFSHSLYLCSIFRCQKTAAPPDSKTAASADMKSSPQFRPCPPVSYDQRTQKQCRRKCKRQQGKNRRRHDPHRKTSGTTLQRIIKICHIM